MSMARRTQEGFSPSQLRRLSRAIDAERIRQRRSADGSAIAYLEGWDVVAQANAIFGFGGWQREIVHFEKVFEVRRNQDNCCGYTARVKITVFAGSRHVIREGTGFGQASGSQIGDLHERAIKAAETDATKRALSTFGNQFGLSLYRKEIPSGEASGQAQAAPNIEQGREGLVLFGPDASIIASGLSIEGFCSGFRQMIGLCQSDQALEALEFCNTGALRHIATGGIKTQKGRPYADILRQLVEDRLGDLAKAARQIAAIDDGAQNNGIDEGAALMGDNPDPVASSPSNGAQLAPAATGKIDKSLLALGTPRRIRDKAHLRAVAELPCLICNRQPSHPHHLKFAQSHGLSQKVSDEYVVPLCALHHGDLHRAAREEKWWQDQRVDPLPVAQQLWAKRAERHEDVS